ncbi:type VII secretion integral membrane protein EccD [Nocardia salmonicida]|uniref:type VII secretion integral membrane protein EccD n=1 Tax=Nocardia salmonicida TaxID=53431 RepID=UPI002E2AC47D|nr:type VII secretion integral membrane protein EccD [Nocardia salmonicida]
MSTLLGNEPELCRVSVIGGDTQLDIGLPATVPIAGFIGDLVSLIRSRDPRLPDGDEDSAPVRAQHWTLARLGQDPLAPNRTLTEAEVYDGELLVLSPVTRKESPALFDDVIDAVSRLTAGEFRGWSGSAARWTGLVLATVAILAALALLVVSRASGDPLVPALVLLVAGIFTSAVAGIAARKYLDPITGNWLSLDALLLLFGGGALLVPGALGAAHVLLGSVVLLVAAIVGHRVTGIGAGLFAAAITMSVIAAGSATVSLIWEPAPPKLFAGVLIAGIVLLSSVPRLAAVTARLPIPPVPTAGGAIDPADHEQRPTIEGIGAIGAIALPSAAGLGERARVANQIQTGLVAACAATAGLGAFGTVNPFGPMHSGGVALAVVTAIILCLRGRSFADLGQAATLIAGGALTLIAVVFGLGLGHGSLEFGAIAMLLVIALGVVGFGVVGPHVEVTPVTRRMVEIFEYLLIITMIPLALWVMDVYSAARNI